MRNYTLYCAPGFEVSGEGGGSSGPRGGAMLIMLPLDDLIVRRLIIVRCNNPYQQNGSLRFGKMQEKSGNNVINPFFREVKLTRASMCAPTTNVLCEWQSTRSTSELWTKRLSNHLIRSSFPWTVIYRTSGVTLQIVVRRRILVSASFRLIRFRRCRFL